MTIGVAVASGGFVGVAAEVGTPVFSTSVGCAFGVAVTTRTVAVAVGIGVIVDRVQQAG
jgi:hypothetical protein